MHQSIPVLSDLDRIELSARIKELEGQLAQLLTGTSATPDIVQAQLISMCDAQRSMEDARDRYASLYDDAPIAYFTLSRRGLIQSQNLTAARLIGFERTSILGRPLSTWVCKSDRMIFFRHFKDAEGCRKARSHDAVADPPCILRKRCRRKELDCDRDAFSFSAHGNSRTGPPSCSGTQASYLVSRKTASRAAITI